MPLRKKLTLIPDTRNPYAFTDDYQWTFLFIIMMPNTVGAITRAIRQNNYLLAFLCLSVCGCFFLLQLCLSKYLSLPKNERSSQKLWLKLNMWFLYTVISFGFVYQFADFFPVLMTVALYSVVSLCSLFLFYVFVVVDFGKYWKIWRYGEDEHRMPENEILHAGKLRYYPVSIWEKV